ncbi:sulfatase-like hydrolase/transferase [Pseudomaricurvus alkylphenolicus]|uniref:sulfatase-like hydrolase/transferase n=1 Tax=Pseudomaricurvus alkylphenolicus TaxID=1306991 RepID=UPI00141E25E7|nr:sulfatase-like hydrolase/transferase [Pseudomaricurvus alkylphenolicus]NIB40039.1 sulfatase-like hydrolase/transferase [Pseudomaricurvus alkylphenolicus]
MPTVDSLRNSIVALVISTTLAAQLFILTPLSLYLTNLQEVGITLGTFLRLCLIPAVLLVLVLFILQRLLAGRVWLYLQLLQFALIVCLWLQANAILWDYGILDGRAIDWGQYPWQGWVDASIWIAVFIAVFRFGSPHLQRLSKLLALILLIQLAPLAAQIYESRHELASIQSFDSTESLDQLYRFSSKHNVIHLTVDGFQADVFDELINRSELGAAYRESFTGFTYYRENLGVFPYTRFAIPAFLAGRVYDNQTSKDSFIDDVFSGKNILNSASEQGYEVDLGISGDYWLKRYSNTSYKNIFALNSDALTGSVHTQFVKLMDLSLFRSLPHFLKPAVYRGQSWLLSSWFSQGNGLQHLYFKHTIFLLNFEREIRVDRDAPVYKYFHIMNTHNPMVVDGRCHYSGRADGMNRQLLTYQSKCTLDTLASFFNVLKERGLYDDSLIIIQGDHGGWPGNRRKGPPIRFPNGNVAPDWLSSLASPLLAIKPPSAAEPLKTSDKLTSLLQLPDTISDILQWQDEFGQQSILDMADDDLGSRSFYFYAWQRDAWETEFAGPIVEFEINGSHYESQWIEKRVIHPIDTSRKQVQ